MARLIHCESCKNRMVENSKKYGELYEFIEGIALKDLFCDGSCFTKDGPKLIKKGEICFAAVLLRSKENPNYLLQHPVNWCLNYINPA